LNYAGGGERRGRRLPWRRRSIGPRHGPALPVLDGRGCLADGRRSASGPDLPTFRPHRPLSASVQVAFGARRQGPDPRGSAYAGFGWSLSLRFRTGPAAAGPVPDALGRCASRWGVALRRSETRSPGSTEGVDRGAVSVSARPARSGPCVVSTGPSRRGARTGGQRQRSGRRRSGRRPAGSAWFPRRLGPGTASSGSHF